MNSREKIDSLVEILLDPYADIADQDDAAGYLGDYDDDKALISLIRVSQGDIITDFSVLQTCGESIARIWIRRKHIDRSVFISLNRQTKLGVLDYLEGNKPDWKEQYDLHLEI